MKIYRCNNCGTYFSETKTECPRCTEKENVSAVIEDNWEIWFSKIKAIRPDEIKSFLETLTEFVKHFPISAKFITLDELESTLSEIRKR